MTKGCKEAIDTFKLRKNKRTWQSVLDSERESEVKERLNKKIE